MSFTRRFSEGVENFTGRGRIIITLLLCYEFSEASSSPKGSFLYFVSAN